MTAHLFDALQVLLAAAEVVCKGDKMTSLQKTVKIQKKKRKKKEQPWSILYSDVSLK